MVYPIHGKHAHRPRCAGLGVLPFEPSPRELGAAAAHLHGDDAVQVGVTLWAPRAASLLEAPWSPLWRYVHVG